MNDQNRRKPHDRPLPTRPDGKENDSAASQAGDGDSLHGEIPTQLQNWHVIEIDGEATYAETVGRSEHEANRSAHAGGVAAIDEHYDEVVVVTLAERLLVVDAGQTIALEASVLNNGEWSAVFEITVEGWIDERWPQGVPLNLPLKAGERRRFSIPIALPRNSTSTAGEHPMAVVVRANSYPGRYSRAGVNLVIRPYDDLQVSPMRPRRLTSSWLQRSDTLILPLTNGGNHPARVRVYGIDRRHECTYEFLQSGGGPPIYGRAQLLVEPGQSVDLPVQVSSTVQPFLGLAARVIPFWIVVSSPDSAQQQRTTEGELVCSALVGPWQLAGLVSMVALAIVGLGLAGLAVLVALRPEASPPPVRQVAEAPIVAFVLKVDEPVPTRLPAAMAGDAAHAAGDGQPVAPSSQASDSGDRSQAEGVVSADQVTSPGEPTPTHSASVARPTAVVVVPPSSNSMTYAQMFQAVAQEYDFDWRMLAAQAYVESGFDSLALGSHGDLGLMQVRPSTWQEWAPIVNVDDPFDSYSNVRVGAAYLDYLRGMFAEQGYPQPEWMLVAYNWGPDKLGNYLQDGGTWDSLGPELQGYVQDVMRIAESIPTN